MSNLITLARSPQRVAPTVLTETEQSSGKSEPVLTSDISVMSGLTTATSASSTSSENDKYHRAVFDSPGEKKIPQTPPNANTVLMAEAAGSETQRPLTRSNSGSLPDLRIAEAYTEQGTGTCDMSDLGYDGFFIDGGGFTSDSTRQPLSEVPEEASTLANTPPSSLQHNQLETCSKAMHIANSPPVVAAASSIGPSSMASSTQSSYATHSMDLHAAQPLLYSAIGSLEKQVLDSKSVAQYQNRFHPKSREFRSSEGVPLISPHRTQHRRSKSQLSDSKSRSLLGVGGGHDVSQIQSTAQRPSVKSVLRKANKEQTPADSKHGSGGSHGKKKDRLQKKPRRVSISTQAEERFLPVSEAFTPRERKNIKYKPAEMRTPVQSMSSTMGTLQRPNFRNALRRVAMIIRQHIVKIERRFEHGAEGLFSVEMKDLFSEENFVTPRYKCTMVRVAMARPSTIFGMRKIPLDFSIPTEEEIYEFGHQLFDSVQLSSECSIVCLIYVERLMEVAKVPLVASTWRPIFMCGLLLASKVWQDLASWNIEFASVYPQYSLDAINRLELEFLRMAKWDLYISSSLYAKYYFALRSLVEKRDFRQRYNRMVGGVDSVAASEALKVQKRTELIKEEALMQLSRSM